MGTKFWDFDCCPLNTGFIVLTLCTSMLLKVSLCFIGDLSYPRQIPFQSDDMCFSVATQQIFAEVQFASHGTRFWLMKRFSLFDKLVRHFPF